MEFFVCPCNSTGIVSIDGVKLGANKDAAGKLKTYQCNRGLHEIALACDDGTCCVDSPQEIAIEGTNPINPLRVCFTCSR